jgi:hypothetical protein
MFIIMSGGNFMCVFALVATRSIIFSTFNMFEVILTSFTFF